MNVAELIALAALVRADTEAMIAGNQERAHEGYSPAYSDADFWANPATKALREELERRGLFAADTEDTMSDKAPVEGTSEARPN